MKILAILALLLTAGFAHADRVDKVIKTFQDHGIVSNYQLRGPHPPSISVRPVFHQLDIDLKEVLGSAFLTHARRDQPNRDISIIVILDSRNNNRVGTYSEELGLVMFSPYD